MNNSIFDDFKNAWQKQNNAPAQLIIINVVVYLFLGALMVVTRIAKIDGVFEIVHNQFSIPPIFGDFLSRPWTLLTYGFAHSLSDIFHILKNMLFFYWFSKVILEYLGNKKVISLYVLGVLAGGVAYLFVYNFIPYFQEQAPMVSGMVGASAAVTAIVVAAAVLTPNYTFFLLLFGPVKIKYIAAFFVVISFLGATGGNAGGNIAHLGGAAIGWIFIVQLRKGNDIGNWVVVFTEWVGSLFESKPKIKVTHKSTKTTNNGYSQAASSVSKPDQDEIDAILDKISHSGYDSLSKEEKQKLFNASKK
jgi:membrane associated rhomboid family serine protease